MARRPTLDFLKTETGAGVALALAVVMALVMANSPFADDYFGFIHAPIPIRVGDFAQTLDVLAWTRDGLMTVFFLVVGLEIKYEVLRGEFSSPRRLALPVFAAVGGMAGPALVYLVVNLGAKGDVSGWPIATPTDVAFSLAALSVFGRRLPESLRLFLLTLAVADDLGAIILIGVVYSTSLDEGALAGAVMALGGLAALSRWRTAPRLFYAIGFILVWAFTLKSGINTSIAGFLCAMVTPVDPRRADQDSMLKTFMDGLHPYVAYAILPFFAFVSAGFSIGTVGWRELLGPVPVGIVAALLLGKPLGVMAASGLAVVTRLARRPLGARWSDLTGVAMLCGAGFTLSFFLGALAYPRADEGAQGLIRAAVTIGSTLSIAAGGALLTIARRSREP